MQQLWGQLPEAGSSLLLKLLQYFEIIYHVQEDEAGGRYYLVPHLLEVRVHSFFVVSSVELKFFFFYIYFPSPADGCA